MTPTRPGNDFGDDRWSLLDGIEKVIFYIGVGLGSVTVIGLVAGVTIAAVTA